MQEAILAILPERFRVPVLESSNTQTEEIRLRCGQAASIINRGRELSLQTPGKTVTTQDLNFVLSAAAGASLYAYNDTLRQGYLTLRGGHRLGICGEAVMQDGEIKTLQHISSISVRVAGERIGIGMAPEQSTLILGLPGSGKTTLLRDCIRILSDEQGKRVSLVDERGEIAASVCGIPQFSVGRHTDILTGISKAEGTLMLLRTMNPQWIAVDEITKDRDAEALAQVSYCGVKLLATAHAGSVEDLHRRPVYRRLLEQKIFSRVLILHADHSYTMQRVDET